MDRERIQRNISRVIDPEVRHFLSHGDGVNCIHPEYSCEQLHIMPYPVLDTMFEEPILRSDIRMACLCDCQPCDGLRVARHSLYGVPGYPPGVVESRDDGYPMPLTW